MTTPADKSGRIDLIPEGFTVTWDVHGLEIRVTDYHNVPLRLAWPLVQDLAKRAGASARQGDIDRAGAGKPHDGTEPGREEALKVLELTPTATAKEIKEAHRNLSKVWNPDKLGRNTRLRTKARNKLKLINEAYQTLKGDRPAAADRPPIASGKQEQAVPPPPSPRQISVGDETQMRPPLLSEIRVPEGALALLVVEGGALSFPITSETARVGRFDPVTSSRPEVDLSRLDINRSVSRRHARVVLEGGRFLLSEETGVLNGTFINGRRLTPGERAPLQAGDKIAFGDISVTFKTSEPAGRRPSTRKG